LLCALLACRYPVERSQLKKLALRLIGFPPRQPDIYICFFFKNSNLHTNLWFLKAMSEGNQSNTMPFARIAEEERMVLALFPGTPFTNYRQEIFGMHLGWV
jgi:hypothetical protein